MRFLTRVTVAATVTLVLAGCFSDPNDDGCNFSGNGLAGNGTFTYACAGAGDPQCDRSTFGDAPSMPLAVARGSEFDLRFSGNRPSPLSTKAVRDTGRAFEALVAGNAGFVVLQGEEAVDAFRLTVTEPDGLAIGASRSADSSWERWSAAARDQEIPPGEIRLRALALAGSTTLAGAVTGVTWTIDPPESGRIEPLGGGVWTLETLRPGIATLRLSRGELFAIARIRITERGLDAGLDGAVEAGLDAGGDP